MSIDPSQYFSISQVGVGDFPDVYASRWGRRRSISNKFVVTPSDESFLRLAVRYGVVPYVRMKGKKAGIIQNSVPERVGTKFPLLVVALCCDVPNPAMVECLLDLGADPKLEISKQSSQTPWTMAVTRVSTLYVIQSECSGPEEYLVAENMWKRTLQLMFLRGGRLAKVPDSLLTSVSRKLLKEITDEAESKEEPAFGLRGWFTWFKLY